MKKEEHIAYTVKRQMEEHGRLTVGTQRKWDAHVRQLAETQPHVMCDGAPFLFSEATLALEGVESGAEVSRAELHGMMVRSAALRLASIEREIKERDKVN